MTQVLLAEISKRRPHLNPRLFQVGFVEVKMVLGQIYL